MLIKKCKARTIIMLVKQTNNDMKGNQFLLSSTECLVVFVLLEVFSGIPGIHHLTWMSIAGARAPIFSVVYY